MKRNLIFCMLLLTTTFWGTCFAQKETVDVVHLKNGSIIKGTLQELIPNDKLKISTSDGSLFVFALSEVEKIMKEDNSEAEHFYDIDDNENVEVPKKRIHTSVDTYREPVLSFLGSMFFPGIGQIYNGQIEKGLAMMGWYAGSYIVFGAGFYMLASGLSEGAGVTMVLMGMLSAGVCWVTGMVDAVVIANKINLQLGYAQLKIGEKTMLSLQPDLKLQSLPSEGLVSQNTTVAGLSLRLNF